MTEVTATVYVYLRPQPLDMAGYVYGAAVPSDRPDVYRVSRLNNGWWGCSTTLRPM